MKFLRWAWRLLHNRIEKKIDATSSSLKFSSVSNSVSFDAVHEQEGGVGGGGWLGRGAAEKKKKREI